MIKNNSEDKNVCANALSKKLMENICNIKSAFGKSDDLAVNLCNMGEKEELACAIIYIKSLTDDSVLDKLSIKFLNLKQKYEKEKPELFYDALVNSLTGFRDFKEGKDFNNLYKDLLSGKIVFLYEGIGKYLALAVTKTEGRAITEPTSQATVKGPKDAFTEDIDKNVYLIRKRINNKALRVENLTVGSVTHTGVRLIYLSGTAKDEIVQEVRDRISKLNNDSILESEYIEEFIKEDRYSIFPTILSSERPDAVAGALLEGRVAILADGTPFVLTAPALMYEFVHASEDYYHGFMVASFMRLLRYVALSMTLMIPALYIAVSSFHHEVIPTPLLLSIAAQREGLPLPSAAEVFLMELVFELLREAGIRMQKAIGPAISIVGALVLGQSAVEAGLVSAGVVIVVSITAISSFAITNYEMSNCIRLLRFGFILISSFLGLLGMSILLITVIVHLCKLKTIGVPYLTPIAPKTDGCNKDTILRFPLWLQNCRPPGISKNTSARATKQSPVNPSFRDKPELR